MIRPVEKEKLTTQKKLMLALPALIAFILGMIVLVWGPYQDNQQLKSDNQKFAQPIPAPTAIVPDQQTASSLPVAFSNSKVAVDQLKATGSKSGIKISNIYQTGQNNEQVVVAARGSLKQVAAFNSSLGKDFFFLPSGQARGQGPAWKTIKFDVTPITTSRDGYKLSMTLTAIVKK